MVGPSIIIIFNFVIWQCKIDGIVIHDNLKSAYKNQIKKLAEELDVPTFKHKKLRNPKDLPIW